MTVHSSFIAILGLIYSLLVWTGVPELQVSYFISIYVSFWKFRIFHYRNRNDSSNFELRVFLFKAGIHGRLGPAQPGPGIDRSELVIRILQVLMMIISSLVAHYEMDII